MSHARLKAVVVAAAIALTATVAPVATAPQAQAAGTYCTIKSGQDWYGGWVDATCSRRHRAAAQCTDGSWSYSALGTGKQTAICWWKGVKVSTVVFN